MSSEDSIRGKNLLVISTGSDKKKNIFKQLHQLGLNIILLDQEMTPWAKQYVKKFIKADTNNTVSAVKSITDYQSKSRGQLDGVLTFWEESTPLAAAVANKLHLPGFNYRISKVIKHKANFRKLCKKYNIAAPKYRVIKTKADLNYVKRYFDFPIVVKPVYGSASVLVVKVEKAKDLDKTYTYIRDKQPGMKDADWLSLGTEILAEEYIGGKEVDIDVLIQNGKIRFFSVCDNLATNEPYFIETGFNYPSTLSEKHLKSIAKLTDKTVRAFGLKNGCLHYEAKIDKGEVVPIELNMRLGGDGLEKIIWDCYAIDIVELIAKIALGIRIPDLRKIEPVQHVIGRYILPLKSGTINKIKFPRAIKELDYVQDFYLGKHAGDKVGIPPLAYDYLGWLNVRCDDHGSCLKLLRALLSKIKIKID